MSVPYLRGLREPHIEFVDMSLHAAEVEEQSLDGCVYLRVTVPVWESVARDITAAVTLDEWPNLAGRINDACRSYHPSKAVASSTYPVEPTEDPDEPRAWWIHVVTPIPKALFADRAYDIGKEIVPEILDGVALVVRQQQAQRLEPQ